MKNNPPGLIGQEVIIVGGGQIAFDPRSDGTTRYRGVVLTSFKFES